MSEGSDQNESGFGEERGKAGIDRVGGLKEAERGKRKNVKTSGALTDQEDLVFQA